MNNVQPSSSTVVLLGIRQQNHVRRYWSASRSEQLGLFRAITIFTKRYSHAVKALGWPFAFTKKKHLQLSLFYNIFNSTQINKQEYFEDATYVSRRIYLVLKGRHYTCRNNISKHALLPPTIQFVTRMYVHCATFLFFRTSARNVFQY